MLVYQHAKDGALSKSQKRGVQYLEAGQILVSMKENPLNDFKKYEIV